MQPSNLENPIQAIPQQIVSNMLVDPFRLAIALVPLAAYLLLVGMVNLRRRPFLTSGGSDLAALGLALTGLVFVGPLDFLRPEPATAEFGNYVWLCSWRSIGSGSS